LTSTATWLDSQNGRMESFDPHNFPAPSVARSSPERTAKRRRIHFSLQTIFAVTTVVCVMVAGHKHQGLLGIFPMSALVLSGLMCIYAAIVSFRRNMMIAIFMASLGAFLTGLGSLMFTFTVQQ
tara:strand:+ start:554 stop:925 length:372 start_codon:yes stop_codon:yes gene_type:complete